ncbi:MAG: uracil-DNA glycosylase family protein [Balneolaceae bacterium]
MKEILRDIGACTVCKEFLPLGPRPIVSASPSSKILIIGQAPGSKVHSTGIPWDDPSGERLRDWMGIDTKVFYDNSKIALIPMGFCYPGRGKSGDLPPRPECAPLWHNLLFNQMKEIQLTLLIGQYAQRYYLKKRAETTLTETVRNFRNHLPQFLPLPHPSPRNNIWLKKNPWFESELLPILKEKVAELI